MALSDFVGLMGGLTGTATTSNVYTNSLGGATIYYPEFNQQAVLNQYQNLLSQVGVGQAIGGAVQKAKEKAKGFLAELREEIDAWHGDCLRV
jgi:hypothetical protein